MVYVAVWNERKPGCEAKHTFLLRLATNGWNSKKRAYILALHIEHLLGEHAICEWLEREQEVDRKLLDVSLRNSFILHAVASLASERLLSVAGARSFCAGRLGVKMIMRLNRIIGYFRHITSNALRGNDGGG